MDLVCITDHDSIDGALELLDRHPGADDVIVGEEVTCYFPGSDLEVHIAAYDMTEARHRDVRAAGVPFALNHLLHFYRGQVPFESYLQLLDEVPALEVRNGTMLPGHNMLSEQIAAGWVRQPDLRHLAMIAGSDAHTLRRVGLTWTEAPGRTREEFLANVWSGHGRPEGRHGSIGAVSGDAYGVVGAYMAALAGFGPRDVRSWRRAGCLAFAAASIPFQFVPLAVAAARKLAERREVERARLSMAPERAVLDMGVGA
jgi:hypothetical protein